MTNQITREIIIASIKSMLFIIGMSIFTILLLASYNIIWSNPFPW